MEAAGPTGRGPTAARGAEAPAARDPAASFTFAVMGCAHHGLCAVRELRRAAAKIRELRPDFVQVPDLLAYHHVLVFSR
ncbi:MAG TPA: hypothetical protein VGQ83_25915 [Polyangia bacterium]